MSEQPIRRVVTGVNAEGKSCVILDGPAVPMSEQSGLIWRAESLPMDNSSTSDCGGGAFSFDLLHNESPFMVMDFPADMGAFWHATDTTEYTVMLSGEIVLELEEGEVRLRAGEFLVNRGVVHSWRNDSGAPARAAIVSLAAKPVGKGRTL